MAMLLEVTRKAVNHIHKSIHTLRQPSYDKIREHLEAACPYEAPAAPGQPEEAAEKPAGAAPGSSEDGDWMAIFEEAEKKMKGSDDDVELTEGSGKKDTE